MNTKTRAIVLNFIKFNEKSLIVKCFTLSDGLKTYFIRDAFTSSKKRYKAAYFQPFTILEIEVNHRNKGNLELFKDVRAGVQYGTIPIDIVKSTIIIFLSEVLSNSIKEEERNENLFLYLETALIWLDTHKKNSNFHLILLLDITKYLGFYPDISDSNLPFFDISEGVFTSYQGIGSLTEYHTDLFKILLNLKFDDNQARFHFIERQILLNVLMNYYLSHIEGFRIPKSLQVLKDVFS